MYGMGNEHKIRILYNYPMNTLTRSYRTKKVTEVIELIDDGFSISAACEKVGLSRSSFYEIRNQEPEMFINLQERLSETNREQLASIMIKRVGVLYLLIEDGLSDETKPLDRLAIYKEIEKQLEKLSSLLRMGGGDQEAAADVLCGPILVQGTSRFIAEVGDQQ
jgi:ACT domain-containing protein